MKNKKLLILAAALVVLLAGAGVLYNSLSGQVDTDQLAGQGSASSAQAQDYTAPDFTAYDKDGNAVQLSDYVGKPIVLNFWASWCGPCKMEMPHFQAAFEELGEEVHFLMVNATTSQRESQQLAQDYIDGEGFTFPVLFDLDSQGVYTYGAYSLPSTFFIDREGQLVTYATGSLSAELLDKGIGMILE